MLLLVQCIGVWTDSCLHNIGHPFLTRLVHLPLTVPPTVAFVMLGFAVRSFWQLVTGAYLAAFLVPLVVMQRREELAAFGRRLRGATLVRTQGGSRQQKATAKPTMHPQLHHAQPPQQMSQGYCSLSLSVGHRVWCLDMCKALPDMPAVLAMPLRCLPGTCCHGAATHIQLLLPHVLSMEQPLTSSCCFPTCCVMP